MSFDFSNLDLNIILIPCSGSEYHGEIAHKAAIKLMEDSPISEISSVFCSTIFFKNYLLNKERLFEIFKNHLNNSFVIVINGCRTSCASIIFKKLGVNIDLIINVQDIIPKPKMNLSDLEAFKNMPKLTNIKEEEINKVISHLLLKLKEKILLIRKEIVK
ncbi:MAG: putative zinc-binding protein [Promethearchaeota archaeon]